MERDDLIKIAIAAAVGAVAKELFALLISTSKSAVVALKKKTPVWIAEYGRAADFAFSVGLFVYWMAIFFIGPPADQPVTHGSVRLQIIQAATAITLFAGSMISLIRWLRHNEAKKKPNQLPEPTAGSGRGSS